jgi:hypothetical protein
MFEKTNHFELLLSVAKTSMHHWQAEWRAGLDSKSTSSSSTFAVGSIENLINALEDIANIVPVEQRLAFYLEIQRYTTEEFAQVLRIKKPILFGLHIHVVEDSPELLRLNKALQIRINTQLLLQKKPMTAKNRASSQPVDEAHSTKTSRKYMNSGSGSSMKWMLGMLGVATVTAAATNKDAVVINQVDLRDLCLQLQQRNLIWEDVGPLDSYKPVMLPEWERDEPACFSTRSPVQRDEFAGAVRVAKEHNILNLLLATTFASKDPQQVKIMAKVAVRRIETDQITFNPNRRLETFLALLLNTVMLLLLMQPYQQALN